MPWAVAAAAVAAGGAIYAANKQSSAAKNAADAQTSASQASIAEQQREYDQTRTDQLPFLQAGYGALDKENAFLNGDWSGFMNSPDYQFSLNQGILANDKSAAANGSLYSGGHSADLTQWAEGDADQFANNYWNKLAGQAGQGQVSASNLATAGSNEANSISNLLTNAGNARASSYLQQGSIAGQEAGAVGNAFNQWLGHYQYQQPSYGDYSGSGSNITTSNYLDNSTYGSGSYDTFGLGSSG